MLAEVELSWFVEVDCDTESSTVLRRKLAAYTTYWKTGTEQQNRGVFPRVLWVVPDQDRAEFLGNVISTDRDIEPALFAITTTNQATAVIAGATNDRLDR